MFPSTSKKQLWGSSLLVPARPWFLEQEAKVGSSVSDGCHDSFCDGDLEIVLHLPHMVLVKFQVSPAYKCSTQNHLLWWDFLLFSLFMYIHCGPGGLKVTDIPMYPALLQQVGGLVGVFGAGEGRGWVLWLPLHPDIWVGQTRSLTLVQGSLNYHCNCLHRWCILLYLRPGTELSY